MQSMCVQAIQQDPDYLKAWQRRALVRKQQGDHDGALQDLQAALHLAPASKAIGCEFWSALRSKLKSSGLQLSQGLVSVPVSFVKGAQEIRAQLHGESSTTDWNAQAHYLRGEPPVQPVAASCVKTALGAAQGVDVQGAAGQDGVCAGCKVGSDEATSGLHGNDASADTECGVPPESTRPSSAPLSRFQSGRVSLVAGPLDLLHQPSKVPTTSTEFESYWRGLKGDVEAQARYLRLIEPHALPAIFKSSMTPHILEGIVATVMQQILPCEGLTQDVTGAFGTQVLQSLTNVDRFAMNVMLVPGKKRRVLAESWGNILNLPGLSRETGVLRELRSLYKM
jgi:hypothetical protein